MITAIDTNILLDILVPNDAFYDASAIALQDAAAEGSLVISDIVYAELCPQFDTQRDCDAFVITRPWLLPQTISVAQPSRPNLSIDSTGRRLDSRY